MLELGKKSQSASLVYLSGSTKKETTWSSEDGTDKELGNIFVFDTYTADHYVSSPAEASFTPFGLDILPRLGPVMDRVQTNLADRKQKIVDTIGALTENLHIPSQTEAGKYAAGLGAKSDKTKLERLSTFSESEKQRKLLLTDLLLKDPTLEAEKTKSSKKRIQDFCRSVETVLEKLTPEALASQKDLREKLEKAKKSAEEFRKRQYKTALLPGTGNSKTWRPLWDSARTFSEKSAYPSGPFPAVADDSACVLCQQPLSGTGQTRLLDFATSVAAKEEGVLAEHERILATAVEALAQLPSLEKELRTIAADVDVHIPDAKVELASFSSKLDGQVALLRLAVAGLGGWEFSLPDSQVIATLASCVRTLETLEATQLQAVDPEERKKFQAELNEIVARETLSAAKSTVLSIIANHRTIAQIDDLIPETKTNKVTAFSGKIAEEWVTESFRTHFEQELGRLDLQTIRPVLTAKNDKAHVNYRLTLKEGVSEKLANIASEGEQRCIALAGFLAELAQASHRSAILFDDPVSSLDHSYQDKVTQRLSEESRTRQVIVFTHDVTFLHQLLNWQEVQGLQPVTRSIEWDAQTKRPGAVVNHLPWDIRGVKDQIQVLEAKQRELRASWLPMPSERNIREIKEAYSLLRAAIERATEQVLLGGIVERFQSEVRVSRIDGLVGIPQDLVDRLKALHKKCHGLVIAHASALKDRASLPDPSQFATDLAVLRDWCQEVKDHRKARSPDA